MKKILLILMCISVCFIQACGFEIVDTGNRGVKTRYGKVVGGTLPEGFHWYNPITSNIVELDVREQQLKQNTVCYTEDIQNVDVGFTLVYYPDKAEIHNLYQNVGYDWANKLIPQVLDGKIKEVVGRFEAAKLVNDRLNATTQMRSLIEEELKKKSIIVKDFQVTNLDFNDAFENSVEQKVVAIQNAEAAKNKTVQVQEEADQKVIAAKAEAESMSIRAQALAQNRNLVEYEAVQKWDGKLPTYTLGDSVPFIKIK